MVGHENNLAVTGGQAESDAGRPRTAPVLERWRLRARISRQRLSDLADVSATYVRTIEAGVDDLGRAVVPSPAIMQKLTHGLALALGDGLRNGGTLDVGSGEPAVLARGASRDEVERTIYAELMAAAGYLAPEPAAVAEAPSSPSTSPGATGAPTSWAPGMLGEPRSRGYAELAAVPATVALRDPRLLEHARDLLEHWDALEPADQTLILGVMALIHDRQTRSQPS